MQWNRRKLYDLVLIFICVILIIAIVVILSGDKEEKKQSKQEPKQNKNQQKHEESIQEEPGESTLIRVVIKTDGFAEVAHPQVIIHAGQGMTVQSADESREYQSQEAVTISPDDAMFQNGTIRITPKDTSDRLVLQSVTRGYGTPSYRGSMELFSTAEGIVVVNELPMEEYLYAVVPSEMPASYELEALKTQAVCARSYAWCQSREMDYPEYGAHIDDSTAYQVYGNSQEQESAITAVNETSGEKLWYQEQVVTAYYFSTSCGNTTGISAWGTAENESNAYLRGVDINNGQEDYEKDLPWYSWTATIPDETLSNLISLNTQTEIGNLQQIEVTSRGDGDIAQQIVATGDAGSVTVETENKIRKALGGEGYKIVKQDGTVMDSTPLLPSAFFSIEKQDGCYVLRGGGFGHGIGMSQNGANEMAKQGKTYKEILQLFYQGIEVR